MRALMVALAMILPFVSPGVSCGQPIDQVDAMRVALRHSRTFIDSGSIQIDSSKTVRMERVLKQAAEREGFGFGASKLAVECGPANCRGRGPFRGMVEITSVRTEGDSSMVVQLSMIKVQKDFARTVLRVDDVYLRKSNGRWRIERFETVAES